MEGKVDMEVVPRESELVIAQREKLLRPTWVEISLPALRRNCQRILQLAGRRKVMAVVKAASGKSKSKYVFPANRN